MFHNYQDLITLFDNCFFTKYNTRLVKGNSEPIYLPQDENRPHNELHFAHGFFSSALHETAHWLIAGAERRKLVDFGYWYAPDGRSAEQQKIFQNVEIKPQAIEWILSQAAGYKFQISLDNLDGPEVDTSDFKTNVYNQVKAYCEHGLPIRAELIRQALCLFYKNPPELSFADFHM